MSIAAAHNDCLSIFLPGRRDILPCVLTATRTTVFATLVTVFALSAAQAAEPVVHTDIDTAELAVLLESGTKVVDIRRADEWRETGVIPAQQASHGLRRWRAA